VISDDGLDDAEADAAAMAKSLAELQQKDPEFYKYLQENDADLLDFGAEDAEPSGSKSKVSKATKGKKVAEEADDEDDEMEYDAGSDEDEEEPDFDEDAVEEAPKVEKISVTMNMLRGWQRAMIEVSSSPGGDWLAAWLSLIICPSTTTATFSSLPKTNGPCVPCCRSHERGRGRGHFADKVHRRELAWWVVSKYPRDSTISTHVFSVTMLQCSTSSFSLLSSSPRLC
jgi:hypothetical protein